MRIWLDDVREKPEGFDVHVKTAEEAIVLLGRGGVEEISLDHDLGSERSGETGYFVAKWIEGAAFNGYLKPLKWAIHSANPVGRRNMEMALRKAEQYWGAYANRHSGSI